MSNNKHHKAVKAAREIRNLKEKLAKLVAISASKIKSQGGGCYSTNGVEYLHNNRKDVIAHLCNKGVVKSIHYAPISNDMMDDVVKHIVAKYQIHLGSSGEYKRIFVKYLQQLQDIHDKHFDPYVNGLMFTLTKEQEQEQVEAFMKDIFKFIEELTPNE